MNIDAQLAGLANSLKHLNEKKVYHEAMLYQVNDTLDKKTAEYNRLFQEQIAGQKTLFQDPQLEKING